jgi:hypothetical protein
MEHIQLGYIDIPKNYNKLSIKIKNNICDLLIERLLISIDKELPEHINRVTFLKEVLESSLETNEEHENYEVCSVIYDSLNRLNEA